MGHGEGLNEGFAGAIYDIQRYHFALSLPQSTNKQVVANPHVCFGEAHREL